MDKELAFVLNTQALKDAGFEGSFNDFADDLASEDYIVSGSYDEEGAPVITVVGIEKETLEGLLADHGVEDPSQFTTPVEPQDINDTDLDSNLELNDDNSGNPDEGDDNLDNGDEDTVEIIEDEDDQDGGTSSDEGSAEDQDDNIPDDNDEPDPDDDPIDMNIDVNENKKPRGTQNISESLMKSILDDVKDTYMVKRINERAHVLQEIKENAQNVKINLNSWSNAKVNGTEIWKYRNVDIIDMLAETKKSYRDVYKRFKSLNESMSNDKKKDFVRVLKNQRALIEMLESEYRFRNINEDVTIDAGAATDQPVDDNNTGSDETQEATLTSIVFKVKNADEFIKVLTDHGIPAEALKKGSETPDDGSDNAQDETQDQQPDANAAAAAPVPAPAPAPAPAGGANPFESLTTPLTKANKLNEDGNPFDALVNPDAGQDANIGDPDQAGGAAGVDPLNTEESADAGEGEEVILTDTSYASKVQQILADVYGYDKKEFEDKIGGEIVDEGDPDNGEGGEDNPFDNLDDGSDSSENDEDEIEDEAKVGHEESISPADIFQDI